MAVLVLLGVSASEAQASITHPYTGISFGPSGVGSGTFGDVQSVTVDQASGDVLVYDDTEGGRIYKFDSAGVPVDFSSTGTNVIENVGTTALESEAELAVDDSSGPDAGDIYIARSSGVGIYAESGLFLGELTGGEMCGVAVDSSGNVYVGEYPETVHRYAPSANPVTNGDEDSSMGGLPQICQIAVDGAGDLYTAGYSGGVTEYDALQFGSLSASGTPVDDGLGRTLTIDQSSDEVFIDQQHQIVQYDGSVEPPTLQGSTGASGEGALEESFGVGVDHASGELYAGNGKVVEIFGPGEEELGVSTGAATGVSGSGATLHGTVVPAGTEVTSCVFEYGTEAGALSRQAACSPTAPYSGAPVEVSAAVVGLSSGTVYHYRATIATTNETLSGDEVSFTTSGPSVSEEAFHGVGASEATVTAEIDPHGEATTYRVEYGPSSAYGSSTRTLSAGAGEGPVAAQASISELQPDSAYHFRLVAESVGGTAYGPDLSLHTHPITATGLPDGRGYEMVTPAENYGSEPYVPYGVGQEGERGTPTSRPVRAAANGEAVTYVGSPTSGGGNGSEGEGDGNQFLARRNASGGWTQEDIQPSGYSSPEYWAFSRQLEVGVLMSSEVVAPGGTPTYLDLYTRNADDGTYQALSTVTPPNRGYYQFGAADLSGTLTGSSIGERYAGASADNSHQLFEANDVLASGSVDPGVEANNLYDSVEGRLRTVNILPDGSPAPNASFGGPTGPSITGKESQNAFSHVISANGGRIFWTDMNNGSLYVREEGARTALIAEDATYQTASEDGSKVLYTKAGDLYEDDLESGVTRDLAPGAEVLGLMGTSEDLDYIYFVGQGVLVNGASAGRSNMYLLHGGQIRFIATLGSQGSESTVAATGYPWTADVGYRSSEVTPSGQDVTFMSRESLTGYDNRRAVEGSVVSEPEVYVYDANSRSLSCVSCNPTGEPPTGGKQQSIGGILAISKHSTYQVHVISEDGGRVFFESAQPLVLQAQNGKLNVYEWERDGSGSCAVANGCIYMLTTGSSSSPSYLIDASASGNDVFVMTRSQLVPADKNEFYDVYDVHVGAREAPAEPQCTGTGCQGAAASPPVFATPASTTYNGLGNFTTPATPAAKPKAKPKKKPPSCTKRKPKKKRSAKQAKAKPALCKAKKPAKRARRGANGKGGR